MTGPRFSCRVSAARISWLNKKHHELANALNNIPEPVHVARQDDGAIGTSSDDPPASALDDNWDDNAAVRDNTQNIRRSSNLTIHSAAEDSDEDSDGPTCMM